MIVTVEGVCASTYYGVWTKPDTTSTKLDTFLNYISVLYP
jgi:hypothetical protein